MRFSAVAFMYLKVIERVASRHAFHIAVTGDLGADGGKANNRLKSVAFDDSLLREAWWRVERTIKENVG